MAPTWRTYESGRAGRLSDTRRHRSEAGNKVEPVAQFGKYLAQATTAGKAVVAGQVVPKMG